MFTFHLQQIAEAVRRMEFYEVGKDLVELFEKTEQPIIYYNGKRLKKYKGHKVFELIGTLEDEIGGIVYAVLIYPLAITNKYIFLTVNGDHADWIRERGAREYEVLPWEGRVYNIGCFCIDKESHFYKTVERIEIRPYEMNCFVEEE